MAVCGAPSLVRTAVVLRTLSTDCRCTGTRTAAQGNTRGGRGAGGNYDYIPIDHTRTQRVRSLIVPQRFVLGALAELLRVYLDGKHLLKLGLPARRRERRLADAEEGGARA